jgi:DNA-binding NarL/FixJ family response regulator
MGLKSVMDKTNKALSRKKTIFVVDDHPIVRDGIEKIIEEESDLEIIGEAKDGISALTKIGQLRPDLLIVDISLKDTNGLELIKDIKVQFSNLPILVFSMHDESVYAERVLRAGANGYLMKDQASEYLVIAIRNILDGKIYADDKFKAKIINRLIRNRKNNELSPVERLSDRELEVFLSIGTGYGTREIAEKLHLSIKTIETYRAHLKEKLGLKTAAELLRYSIQWINSSNEM